MLMQINSKKSDPQPSSKPHVIDFGPTSQIKSNRANQGNVRKSE